MADLRRFIETGYFRTMAQCMLDRNIEGNLPQGQRAMMVAALVLGTPDTKELVDWTFNGEGQMRFFLTNHYFKDGSAYESQGYNSIHVYELQGIVDVMERLRDTRPDVFGSSEFPFLFEDPKYKQVFDFPIDFSLIDRTHAQSGDCGGVAGTDTLGIHRTTDIRTAAFGQPFRLTGDRRFARILHGPAGRIPSTVTDSALRDTIRQIVAEDGWQIDQPSNVTDGYGHVILRSGKGEAKRAFWIRYGRSRGHGHDDMLTIGLEAFKRKLLPELGYPRSW